MAHYIRHQRRHTVSWTPDDPTLGFEALVESSVTDITNVADAKSQAPVEFDDGDYSYRDVRSKYAELVAAANQ
jgi:hypothetical protein